MLRTLVTPYLAFYLILNPASIFHRLEDLCDDQSPPLLEPYYHGLFRIFCLRQNDLLSWRSFTAIENIRRILTLQKENGERWSAMDYERYSAYQQALFLFLKPRASIRFRNQWCWRPRQLKEDPKLWYGIGILYDRYGLLEPCRVGLFFGIAYG